MLRHLSTILVLSGVLSILTNSHAQPVIKDRPRDGTLKVGDPAPDFTLKTLDGKEEVKLSNQRGQRPVVLVFGSYT